jgi:hypothetical protein
MDRILINTEKNKFYLRKNEIYFSTRFKQEIPSCPPTAKRHPSRTATPTLVRHELVGATSLLH